MDKVILAVAVLLIYFYTVTCVFFAVEIAALKGRRRRWGWLGLLLGILGVVIVCFLPNAKGVEGETNPVKTAWRKMTAVLSPLAVWILVGGVVIVLGGTLLGTKLTTYLDNRAHEKELSKQVSEAEVLTPAAVTGKVSGVFCGEGSNFAVTEKGDLYGWGTVGMTALDESGKIQTNVQKISRVGEIFYLLQKDGTLLAKGNNKNALIPGQTAETVTEFVKIESDVVDMALSGTVGAILKKSGNLYVVGVNTYGQLGRAVDRLDNTNDKLAEQVKKVVVTGRSLYYLKEDGSVYGVGNNAYGQFGLGHKDAQGAPAKLAENCKDIAAGEDFLLLLKNNGTVWTAGNNCYGQLGREIGDGKLPEGATEEDQKKVAKPEIVFGQVLSLENVTRIEAAGGTAFALADKALYGWGRNHLGQLGLKGSTISAPQSVREKIADLAVGKNCTLLVTEDGKLLGAGDRTNYQLGSRDGIGAFREVAEVKEEKK